jgi:hypothetical protein
MEAGEKAETDGKMLKDLHDGLIEKDNIKMKQYLIKKLQGSAAY